MYSTHQELSFEWSVTFRFHLQENELSSVIMQTVPLDLYSSRAFVTPEWSHLSSRFEFWICWYFAKMTSEGFYPYFFNITTSFSISYPSVLTSQGCLWVRGRYWNLTAPPWWWSIPPFLPGRPLSGSLSTVSKVICSISDFKFNLPKNCKIEMVATN